MLVPIFVSIILLLFFKRSVIWWEVVIPFVFSFLLSLIFHFSTSYILSAKEEYRTTYVTGATYYEEWNEKVYYTETRTDAKGRTYTVRRSRIDYHSPYATETLANGRTRNITIPQYNAYTSLWGNSTFVEMNRNYYTKDGNAYKTNFDNKDDHMTVVTETYLYENKVAHSRSVFNFQPVSDEDVKKLGLISYPDPAVSSFLGETANGSHKAARYLDVFNARYGSSCKVRVWVLVFKNKTLDSGYMQQNYWKNGNMNEFVICIGTDDKDNLTWSHVFSWTDVSTLTVGARNFINEGVGDKVDFDKIVSWVSENVRNKWVIKDFKKDFSYISVDPPFWAILTTFLLTLAFNVGLSYWIITNEFDEFY